MEIFWFSGTGNSLAVARDLARGLEGATLEPIAHHPVGPVAAEGIVGIVCPVYFYGLPLVVRSFLARLDLAGTSYVFVVLTSGGFPGRALREARRRLRRSGRVPDAVFALTMPGNYVAMYDARSSEAAASLIARARASMERVAHTVRDRATATAHESPGAWIASALFAGTFGRLFAATCHGQDRRFYATDACTRCGLCARACPVGNIDLVDGRPRWQRRCEQCFACIHWCPAQAIQIRGKATTRRGRYHHPDVSVDDIASQQRRGVL